MDHRESADAAGSESTTAVESDREGDPAIDWGDQEPDEVWLSLYKRGLVRPPYRGRNSRKVADILAEQRPINFKGTAEDILRALGRI